MNRPKGQKNTLLSALKTKCLKVERRGGLESLKLVFLSAAELKFPTPPRNSRGIDGVFGKNSRNDF